MDAAVLTSWAAGIVGDELSPQGHCMPRSMRVLLGLLGTTSKPIKVYNQHMIKFLCRDGYSAQQLYPGQRL